MNPQQEVDYILHDCFFAVGQAIGPTKRISFDTIVWWRTRYRASFLDALIRRGNSWVRDRERVMAVGQLLGAHAARAAGEMDIIDTASAATASAHVEGKCRLGIERQAAARRLLQTAGDPGCS